MTGDAATGISLLHHLSHEIWGGVMYTDGVETRRVGYAHAKEVGSRSHEQCRLFHGGAEVT